MPLRLLRATRLRAPFAAGLLASIPGLLLTANCGSSSSASRDAQAVDVTSDDAALTDTPSAEVTAGDSAGPDLSSDEVAASDGTLDETSVVPDCGVTIADYCGSTGSCQTSAGIVSTQWDQEQGQTASLCANATRVSTTTCGNYGIVTVGQVDSSTSVFYDLSTLALVRISAQSFTVGTTCVAGIGIQDLSCSQNSPPVNLCAATSGSAD